VQLIDDPNEGDAGGATPGADIDAVGAISSEAATIPEPSTILSIAVVGAVFRLFRGQKK
jgi:hypothetical protein